MQVYSIDLSGAHHAIEMYYQLSLANTVRLRLIRAATEPRMLISSNPACVTTATQRNKRDSPDSSCFWSVFQPARRHRLTFACCHHHRQSVRNCLRTKRNVGYRADQVAACCKRCRRRSVQRALWPEISDPKPVFQDVPLSWKGAYIAGVFSSGSIQSSPPHISVFSVLLYWAQLLLTGASHQNLLVDTRDRPQALVGVPMLILTGANQPSFKWLKRYNIP